MESRDAKVCQDLSMHYLRLYMLAKKLGMQSSSPRSLYDFLFQPQLDQVNCIFEDNCKEAISFLLAV